MSLWSKTDTNLSKPKFLDRGQIVGFIIGNGGTAHVTGTSIATISAPASGVQATATVVATGGAITGLTLTNPGAGYASTDTVTVAISVAGSGASITPVFHGAPYANGNIYFVDNTEASIAANRARGMNAPGWWLYKTKTVDSVVRPIAEHLVAFSATAVSSGDASDDSVLADS